MSKKIHLSPFIMECIDQYKIQFPEDWIEQLNWDSEENANASFTKGRQEILNFVDFCFVRIGNSLLSGEYIVRRKYFNTAKDSFEKYWEKEHLCPDNGNNNALREDLYSLYEELDNHIKALFYAYTKLVVAVDEKLETDRQNYLFKIDTFDPTPTRYFKLFVILREIIIPICYIEHYLAYEDNIRKTLGLYIEHLELLCNDKEESEIKRVLLLTKYKASFILKKLIRSGEPFNILINCDKKTLSRESLPALPGNINKLFYYYECVHEKCRYSDDDIVNSQRYIISEQHSFLDMALLMHYYCSTNKSIQQIDNLLCQFNSNYNKLFQKKYHFTFDNHALCTLQNFMYNCRLSYKVNHEYSLDELEKDIKDIQTIQNETFVYNFYPYKKAIAFLIKNIREKVEQRDLNYDYDSKINLLESYIKCFDKNLEWCENHKFYPIQLPFKECVVEVDGCKVFLPSTVTRPINYKKLREEQASYHRALEFFITSQIYLKDKKDIQNVKDDVRNIEKRYLGLGSILIGVVTFLLGSINIFTDYNASIADMSQAMLGLGIILVIFACLSIIVVENYWGTRPNRGRILICSIITGVCLLVALAFAAQPYFISDDDKTIQTIDESLDTIVQKQNISTIKKK